MRNLICFIIGLVISSSVFAADFTLKSTAFSDKGTIPTLYTCNGKNISPPLAWDNPPAKTQSFILTLSSPGWSFGQVYLWVLFNIPPETKQLIEGASGDLPIGTVVGSNYAYDADYFGPCPPDNNVHKYIFTIYAVDTMLDLSEGADIDDILAKSKRHILSHTQLTGTFSH